MNYRLTWLADVLRAAGLKVIEQPGWKTRGHGDVGVPKGIICHHTAGNKTSDHGSLNIVQNGRSDLAGPLSQLLLARDGTYYVVAAGECYHAGPGNWQGVTYGNEYLIGIEAENSGQKDDPWPEVQMDAYRRGCAAILDHIGAKPIMCCGHREFATPKGRKPDPSFDMVAFRASVAAIMGGAVIDTPPPPAPLKPGDAQEGVVNTADLNLRDGPDGKIITQLPKGQKVAVHDMRTEGSTKWYRVWLRDAAKTERRGWVAARFVTLKT